jgi:hypothetical protein
MGLPIGIPDFTFNSLHMRAYNLIWNEWYRDENQQTTKATVDTDNGPDTYTDYVLLKRGKRHDYFTSCLPYPQKTADTVSLPLGTEAPVIGDGNPIYGHTDLDATDRKIRVDATPYFTLQNYASAISDFKLTTDDTKSGMIADLTDATAATINDLRLAFATQKLYERDARGGTRYQETILSHFRVHSPDGRLQRPEYLGGGSTPFHINPVAQTSATSGDDALGDLGAYGVCAPRGHGFTYSATEHGVLLGIVSVRADLSYQQGMNRMWSRQTRLDYYWPALAHLGEQAVLLQEIYTTDPAGGTNDDVFGYQERFAEYRYKPSQITGLFRSDATGSLDAWHLAQDFGSAPSLGDTFISSTTPMSRIKAVTTEPDFFFDGAMKLICARPMPVYSVPGQLDRF